MLEIAFVKVSLGVAAKCGDGEIVIAFQPPKLRRLECNVSFARHCSG